MSTTTEPQLDQLQAERDRLVQESETATAVLADAEQTLADLNQRVAAGQEVDPQEYSSATQNAVLAGVRARGAQQQADAANEAVQAAQQAEDQRLRRADLGAAAQVHAAKAVEVERLERIAFDAAVQLRNAIKSAAGTFHELESAARAAGLGLTLKDDPGDGMTANMSRHSASAPWQQVGPVQGVRVDGETYRRVRPDRLDALRLKVRDLRP